MTVKLSKKGVYKEISKLNTLTYYKGVFCLKQQQKTAMHVHPVFGISLRRILPNNDVKFPFAMFCGGREHNTTNLLFLFLKLEVISTNSNPGNSP